MTPEEVIRKALRARACAAGAADALQRFVDELLYDGSLTSDAAAHAYMTAVGHLTDALAALNELGVRRSAAAAEKGGQR